MLSSSCSSTRRLGDDKWQDTYGKGAGGTNHLQL